MGFPNWNVWPECQEIAMYGLEVGLVTLVYVQSSEPGAQHSGISCSI